jgi:hypothetical protein
MSGADEQTFVTIIIFAHGQDYITHLADDLQKSTLRKFTVAGRCGNYSYHLPELEQTIFKLCEDFAKQHHIPFHYKLDNLRDILKEHSLGFKYQLQQIYHALEDKDKKGTICPNVDDWFSTAQVSYDHSYSFQINDPSDPWEINSLGIWFVDGSPDARKISGFTGKPLPIARQLGYPEFPKVNFEKYLFEIASDIKKKYRVKYVNFVDLSCRYSPKLMRMTEEERLSRTRSLPIAAPTPRAGAELIDLNGDKLEILVPQPVLPPNWKYVRVIRNDNYIYFNTDKLYFSDSMPKKGGSFLSSKKKKIRIFKKKKSLYRTYRTNLSKRLFK